MGQGPAWLGVLRGAGPLGGQAGGGLGGGRGRSIEHKAVVNMARRADLLGIDLVVLDDGWFGEVRRGGGGAPRLLFFKLPQAFFL